MRWATRAGCHVDRAACAWLIRRYIDPDAKFLFVGDPAEVPRDATPFDMPGVELSHHRGNCSFETFLDRYHLEVPVLAEIARLLPPQDPPGTPPRFAARKPCRVLPAACLRGDRHACPAGGVLLVARKKVERDPRPYIDPALIPVPAERS